MPINAFRALALVVVALAAAAAHADAFQDCRARADRRLMATQDATRHQSDMRLCYRARREGASGGDAPFVELNPVDPSPTPTKPGAKPPAPITPR